MIAGPRLCVIAHIELSAGDLLAELDRLENGTTVGSTAAEIVDAAARRRLREAPDRLRDIAGVKIVADLLSLMADDAIGRAGDDASHQIGKEAVELCTRVPRAGEAAGTETRGVHSEVAAIFLDHDIGGDLRGAEDAVHACIDAHRFINAAGAKSLLGIEVEARRVFLQRQQIGTIA